MKKTLLATSIILVLSACSSHQRLSQASGEYRPIGNTSYSPPIQQSLPLKNLPSTADADIERETNHIASSMPSAQLETRAMNDLSGSSVSDSLSLGWQENYVTQNQIDFLNKKISSERPNQFERNHAYQKAACLIDLTKWTYREVNTQGVTEMLFNRAAKLHQESFINQHTGISAPLNGMSRAFKEHWQQIVQLKSEAGAVCAAKTLACADVALLGAEYELFTGYGKHKNHGLHFEKQAVDLIKQASEEVQHCSEQPKEGERKTFNLSADTLFNFDSSAIKQKEKIQLNKLIAVLNKIPSTNISQIQIIAHTDKLGTDQYNQRLSEKRAETLHAFLKNGLNPELSQKIQSEGKGSSIPVVECNESNLFKLKQCLQPNRRAQIIINGTNLNQ